MSVYETWEITYQSQLCVNKYIYQADHKNEIWKTVKLTSSYYLLLSVFSITILRNFQIILAQLFVSLFVSLCVRKGSLYEGSDRILKAGGSINIHNNP